MDLEVKRSVLEGQVASLQRGQRGSLYAAYPLDMSFALALPHEVLGADGIPYRKTLGTAHPQTVVQYALAQWNLFLATGQDEHRSAFLAQASWLLRHACKIEGGAAGWPLALPGGRQGLSAIVQGSALSVLVRAYFLTQERSFLQLLRSVFWTLQQDILDGGVAAPVLAQEQGFWFEEYACYPATHTLSGMLFALLGLYEYAYLSQSKVQNQASLLFERAFSTLHILLPEFDRGFWVRDNLLDTKLSTPEQLAREVQLLCVLASLTGDVHCTYLAQHWEQYLCAPMGRLRLRMQRFLPHLPWRGVPMRMIDKEGEAVCLLRVWVPITAFPLVGGMRTILEKIEESMAGSGWCMEYLTQRRGEAAERERVQRFGWRWFSPRQFPFVWGYVVAGGWALAVRLCGMGYEALSPIVPGEGCLARGQDSACSMPSLRGQSSWCSIRANLRWRADAVGWWLGERVARTTASLRGDVIKIGRADAVVLWLGEMVVRTTASLQGDAIKIDRVPRMGELVLPQDGVFTAAFAAPVARLFGRRVVCVDHGNMAALPSELYRQERLQSVAAMGWLRRRVEPWLFVGYWPSLRVLAWIGARFVDQYVIPGVAGDGIEEICHELGIPASRLTRFVNTVDVEQYTPLPMAERTMLRQQRGLAADAIILTTICRLSPEKGLEIALLALEQALASLSPQLRTRVCFVIAGEGALRPRLEELILQRGLGLTCVLWGEIAHAEARLLHTLSDLYLYSGTRGGGYSLVMLEAMAAGSAVLASDMPLANVQMLADERGLIVPAGDVVRMAEALVRLIEDESLRKKLGQRARVYVAEHNTEEVFRRVWQRSAFWAELEQLLRGYFIERREGL